MRISEKPGPLDFMHGTGADCPGGGCRSPGGDYNGENRQFILENGYLMLLYQLPMVNTIFFPVLGMVVASRLCDLEHKGDNLKLLCTLEEKGRLFDAKLLYGLGITLF